MSISPYPPVRNFWQFLEHTLKITQESQDIFLQISISLLQAFKNFPKLMKWKMTIFEILKKILFTLNFTEFFENLDSGTSSYIFRIRQSKCISENFLRIFFVIFEKFQFFYSIPYKFFTIFKPTSKISERHFLVDCDLQKLFWASFPQNFNNFSRIDEEKNYNFGNIKKKIIFEPNFVEFFENLGPGPSTS